MKKKLVLLGLIGTIIITGCSNEKNYKVAIEKSINSTYLCLDLSLYSTKGAPYGISKQQFNGYIDKNTYVVVSKLISNGKEQKSINQELDNKINNKFNALVKAGLLTKTEETIQATDKDIFGQPIKNTAYVVDFYNLTEKGKQTEKSWNTSSLNKALLGSKAGHGIFCYAHPEVDSIMNFTENDADGQKSARVKYSYKYADIADWINDNDIKASFPEINEILDKSDKTSTMNLIKTKDGWQ